MADYTSSQAGDWNASATWGGSGTPSVDADTATIGHAVAYNLGDSVIDFGNVTINSGGTLTFPTDANSTINFNATAVFTINDGGTLTAGTSTTPIGASYHCYFYWDHGTANRYSFVYNGGATLNIYGNPAFYGNKRFGDLDSDWSSGQTLYITGNYSSTWQSGQKFWLHKNQDYDHYSTDSDIFTIDTVGSYDSSNDRTPITIDETAPGVTFYATHTSTGYQSQLVMISRNVELADASATLDMYGFNSFTQYMRFDTNNIAANRLFHINNVLMYGWRGCTYSGNKLHLSENVYVNNLAVSEASYNSNFLNETLISNDNGILYGGEHYIENLFAGGCRSPLSLEMTVKNITMVGCVYAVQSDFSNIQNGVIVSCNDGIMGCELLNAHNIKFLSNDTAVVNVLQCSLTNCTFDSNTTDIDITSVDDHSLVIDTCDFDSEIREYEVYISAGNMLNLKYSDTNWQTPPSNNDWILEAAPTSVCSDLFSERIYLSPLRDMFDYAPSGSRTLTFKIYPVDWTTTLNQDDVVLELNYLDSASGVTRTTTTNSSQTYANGAWRDVTVSFSPTQGGVVYFNLYIKKYEASCYILIDPVWSLV